MHCPVVPIRAPEELNHHFLNFTQTEKRPTSVLTCPALMTPLFCRFYAKHPVKKKPKKKPISQLFQEMYRIDLSFNLKPDSNLPAAGAVIAPSGRRGSVRDILREKKKKKGKGSDPLS